jgi:dTDP-4-dehydrorhamnose reductase
MKPAREKPLVWITGAGGLIGSNLLRSASNHAPEFAARGLIRQELDLTDFASVRRLYREEQPDWIIHCAAMSRTPDCQAQPARAWLVNVEATRLLSDLDPSVPMVFFSTDLVFDGRGGAYCEGDSVNPLSYYAETKVEAERIVGGNPRHIVIRTSLNGGTSPTGDRGFNEELRNAWRQGRRVSLFVDEYRSPIPAMESARAVWHLVRNGVGGIFHLAGCERLSRWEIGQLVAARWPSLNPQIATAKSIEYTGPPRPPDTSLNCDKIQSLLPFKLPGLSAWLKANPGIEF